MDALVIVIQTLWTRLFNITQTTLMDGLPHHITNGLVAMTVPKGTLCLHKVWRTLTYFPKCTASGCDRGC
jgi:hypothetical protein